MSALPTGKAAVEHRAASEAKCLAYQAFKTARYEHGTSAVEYSMALSSYLKAEDNFDRTEAAVWTASQAASNAVDVAHTGLIAAWRKDNKKGLVEFCPFILNGFLLPKRQISVSRLQKHYSTSEATILISASHLEPIRKIAPLVRSVGCSGPRKQQLLQLQRS